MGICLFLSVLRFFSYDDELDASATLFGSSSWLNACGYHLARELVSCFLLLRGVAVTWLQPRPVPSATAGERLDTVSTCTD